MTGELLDDGRTVTTSSTAHWQCPLESLCTERPYATYASGNEAVRAYQETHPHETRRCRAVALYERHTALVRKVLRRYCRRSQCAAGRCLPEDLVGESYPIFVRALDEYDGTRGIDFAGYVYQRLAWGLDHHARRLRTVAARFVTVDELPEPEPAHDEEERLLGGILARDLLRRLEVRDAELLMMFVAGYTCHELGTIVGASAAAVRKRLERIRRRLRRAAERGPPGAAPEAPLRRSAVA